MIDIHLFRLTEIAVAMFLVAKAGIAEGKHIKTMDTVHFIQTTIPHLKVR